MKFNLVVDTLTNDYFLIVAASQKEFVFECFAKSDEKIIHGLQRITRYSDSEKNRLALVKITLEQGRIISRPYRLGQWCDGTISTPVSYLFHSFCTSHNIDATALYASVYRSEDTPDWNLVTEFALWQGTVLPEIWNEESFNMLIESMGNANFHELKYKLLEHAPYQIESN